MKHHHRWKLTRMIFPFKYGWAWHCEWCNLIDYITCSDAKPINPQKPPATETS